MWLLAGPIKCNWPSVTLWSVFQYPVTYITNGYTNWKDAINNFNQHERSKCHADSVLKIVTIPKTMKDVGECLSSQHAKEKSERRQLFMKILQNIAFLAYQGLPLRGDGSEDDSNYIQLLNLWAIDDPRIIEWLQKRSDKYTSPVIQNEILKIMALKIIQKLLNPFKVVIFLRSWQMKLLMLPIRNRWLFACDGWIITLRHMRNSLGCMKLIPLMLVHCTK